MKRSSLFLAAALTVPALMSIAGAIAGTAQLKPGETQSQGPTGSIVGPDSGDMSVVKDESVPLASAVAISANDADIEISFDQTLNNQAHVKVEAKTGTNPIVTVTPSKLFFKSEDNHAPLHVTLTLPTQFLSLDLTLNAAHAKLSAQSPLNIATLHLTSNASNCDLDLDQVDANNFVLSDNAGKINLKFAGLATTTANIDVNAGNLDWDVKTLTFTGTGERSLGLTVAAGKSEFHFGTVPAHGFRAVANLGHLEFSRAGQHESLNGLAEKRTVDAPAGAPIIDIKVSTGSANLTMDEVK